MSLDHSHSKTFQELDMYDLDALLTDEERMIRDHVRSFVDGDVLPHGPNTPLRGR